MVVHIFLSLTYQILKKEKKRTSVVLSASFGVGLWKDVTTLSIKCKYTVNDHYWPNGPLLSIKCKALWMKRKTLPESSAEVGI